MPAWTPRPFPMRFPQDDPRLLGGTWYSAIIKELGGTTPESYRFAEWEQDPSTNEGREKEGGVFNTLPGSDPGDPAYALDGGTYAVDDIVWVRRSQSALPNWDVIKPGGGGGSGFSGARVYKNSQTAIAASTVVAITWNQVRFDTDGYHSGSRFTAPADGYYVVGFHLTWEGLLSDYTNLLAWTVVGYLQVNGANTIAGDTRVYKTTGNQVNQPVRPTVESTTLWYFQAGDYVETKAYHDLSVSRNIEASTSTGVCYASEGWIYRVG